MIVLDSNVISEIMLDNPDPRVIAWFNAQPAGDICTTAINVFEVRHGLALLPAGKKKQRLNAAFDLAVQTVLGNRVLNLDAASATEAATLSAKLSAIGRPIEFRDAMIAGTVAVHQGSTLATRNIRHFTDTGIALVDPWSALSP